MGIKEKPNDIKLLKKKELKDCKNVIVLGSLGNSKVHHPWDFLKTCDCGNRPFLMYDKNKPYYCGGATDSVFALCTNCGKNTKKSNIETVIDN